MSKSTASGYNIQNILLIHSNFWRAEEVVGDDTVKNNVNVDSDFEIKGKQVVCMVTLTFQSMYKEEAQIESSITMVGLFGFKGKPDLNTKAFGEVNGPSIIFPYVREHLSSMSTKAAINPILLPPVNFVALAEQKKKKLKKKAK